MTEDEYADDGRRLDEEGRPIGTPLAGPGEDGPEPPEGERALDLLGAHLHAEGVYERQAQGTADYAGLPDPAYVAQEGSGEWPTPDAWAATQEQLREELERAPLQAVDPDDDRFAEAVYVATLREPYGDAVPAWEHLGDRTRDTYRRQAHRARELLGLIGAAGVEPQRVVIGFGSPATVADVLGTLRRWRDLGAPTSDDIGALVERIEQA